MEIWDLYDLDRNLTGRTMVRGQEVPQGCYHLVVHVWITDGEGRWLISQRAADRPTNPGKWECVGGHVTAGEDSLGGALRETLEEVGVELEPEGGELVWVKLRHTENGKRLNDILDVWRFRYSGPVDLEKAETKEVAQVRWATAEEIADIRRRGELVPTLEYFFEKVIE